MRVRVTRAARFSGTTQVPGDKSISHRALLFSALAQGRCRVENLGPGADVRSTAECLRRLGVPIEKAGEAVEVTGDTWLLRALGTGRARSRSGSAAGPLVQCAPLSYTGPVTGGGEKISPPPNAIGF